MTEGQAKVVKLTDLSQLCSLLQLLEPHQAITCGVPMVGNTPLTTRTGAALRLDAVARTNESFVYPFEAALCPVDIDVDASTYPSVQAVLDALESASPWLRHVHRVARPSSSSFVAGRGLRGVHIYFPVVRGADVPAVGERLKIDQWAAGHGHIKISKSGALLVRQLSDALVYQPSRLMFEAEPLCEGVTRDVPADQMWVERPAIVQAGRPAHWKSPEGWLDASGLPPIKDIDKRRHETAVRQARSARLREAKRIAIDYQKANAIAAGYDALDGERYGLMATRALGDSTLPPSWEIAVKDVGRVKVGDILANIESALGRQCADPFDTWRPDLNAKHFGKAEIVMMGDKAGVWSHKLQTFFAFTADDAGDLGSPLELAAEKLCDLIEYPEPTKKLAPLINVIFALRLLFAETGTLVRYNEATDRTERQDVPPYGSILSALSRVGCKDVSISRIDAALDALAQSNRYDPWKEAMMSLPPWDNVPRLDSVFVDVCGAPPSDALLLTGQLFFAALVRKQFEHGAPCPVVPVLIGGPASGKSQAVQAIARACNAPKPSSIAFSDERKMSMRAARSVLAELSEMAGLAKRENEDVKQWLTDDVDAYRKPYDKEEEEHPRRFVLIGTANKHETNRDETGNRRMMPVHVLRDIDPNWTVELPQILAEAKKRFADDERAYYGLVRAAPLAVLRYNQADMAAGVGMPVNDLDDLLPPILRQQMAHTGKQRVSSAAIRAALDTHGVGRQFSAQKISQWLIARGWHRTNDSQGMRVYDAPDNFLDNVDNSPTLTTVNPFTHVQH